MNEVASEKQTTCCLHGGAGTGKLCLKSSIPGLV